jgi:fibronectin type 3 domain-containing protein
MQHFNVRPGRGPTSSLLLRLSVLALLVLATVAAMAQSAPSGVWAWSNGSNQNGVGWNPVPGATGYNIYAGTTSNGQGGTPVGTTTGLVFYHSSLTAGVKIFYKVTALYGTSESPRSAQVTARPGSDRTGWPLVNTFPANNSITLRWGDVAAATFYRVFRRDPLNNQWYLLATTNAFAYTDNTAMNGVPYTYIVRGGNPDTDLQDSYNVTGIAGDTTLPPPGEVWTFPYSSGIYLYWSPVPGATGYTVFRGTAANGQGNKPYYQTTGTSMTDGTLPGGNVYFYKVSAFDESGTGARSAEITAKVGSALLAAPSLATASGVDKISLNWTAVPTATHYVVFRKTGNGPFEYYLKQPNTAFVDTAVAPGYTYTYYVYAGNADGLGNVSNYSTGKIGSALLAGPTGVYITAGSNYNQVRFNPVSGAASYNVYRGINATSQKLLKANTFNGFTDYDVTPGTTYYYKVRAVYTDGEGKPSAIVSGTPGAVALAATQMAAYPVAGKVNLYWDLVAGAASYNIFRNVANEGWLCIKVNSKPGAGATYGSFADITAKPGVYNTYYVAAVNKDGMGLNSNWVTVTAGNPPIAAPAGAWVFPNSNSLTTYCEPVPGATSYNLYRSTTAGSYSSMPYRVGLGNGFTDSNVTPGTTYFYRWVAVDQDGQSTPSPETRGNAGSNVPVAPILTEYHNATSVTLNWSKPSGATGYNVFRAVNFGTYELVAFDVSAQTWKDLDIVTGVRYSYYVYPVNNNGSGARSNVVSGRPGSKPLAKPTNPIATQQSQGAYLSWEPVAGATSYNVFMSTTSGGQGLVPISVNNGAAYSVGGLTNNQTYYFVVTAVNSNGQSVKSVEFTAEPGTNALTAVSLNVPNVGTPGQIGLSWSSNGSATGYQVFRYMYGGTWQLVGYNVATTSYTDTNVIEGVQYTYYIRPVNATGTGNSSNQRTVVAP